MKKNAGSRNTCNATVQSGFHLRPKVAALAVAACFSSAALANPTAPTVVYGTASFSQAGSILNVTNSHNAIINWGSFSIGVNELTKFIQPSDLSAVLNRVVGQDPSAILGALQSNGRVFLLNPNGIVFGAGSQINVAGMVASTLNMSNADFLAGRMNFTDGAGAGSVVNNGSINASGGPVYMVGNAVTNNGIITSPGGEIVLAAGNSVELVNPGTPNLRVEIQADSNEARNLGSVVADAGRIGIYAGLIKQGGVINANSAVSEGGRIMLKSTKRTDLDSGSVISASGMNGGRIEVLSGMTEGQIVVAGSLDASATGAAGQGGFVETSAAHVAIDASTRVNTLGGSASGRWVIDPIDFTISAGSGGLTTSGIGADTLATNLATSPMEIFTAAPGDNISVDAAVSWNSVNFLKLTAHNNLTVNQPIANAGTGAIHLTSGWDGNSVTTPIVGSTGNIFLNAPVSTQGVMHLIAGGNITQALDPLMIPAISADQLLAVSQAGAVSLDTWTNSVNTIAGSAVTAFYFKNDKSLTVGSVGGVSGISVVNPVSDAQLSLTLAGAGPSNLIINKDILVSGGVGNDSKAGDAKLFLSVASSYGGNISINNATVSAIGGISSTDSGGLASVDVSAPIGNITINSSTIEAKGGNGAGFYGYGGAASINLETEVSGDISVVNGSTVRAIGGDATSLAGSAGIDVSAANQLTIDGSTFISTGGNGILGIEVAGSGGSAYLNLVSNNSSAGGISINASQLSITGGSGVSGYGGSSDVDLVSYAGDITITSSAIDAGLLTQGRGAQIFISASLGDINISGSNLQARAGSEDYYGNSALIDLNATTGAISVTNGSTLFARGSDGGAASYGGSGYGEIDISAAKVITVSGSTLSAQGGDGNSQIGGSGGNAYIDLYSYDYELGGISINTSQLSATGGIGAAGYQDGYANIYVEANSGDIAITGGSALTATGFGAYNYLYASQGSITLENASVSSAGKPGPDGGEGSVYINASSGFLNAATATISATGDPLYSSYYGNEVNLYGGSGVSLGSVTASNYVSVSSSSGAIVDGNNGLNINAPEVYMSAYGGVGSIANPIETLTSSLQVYSQYGDIGIINSGNVLLRYVYAYNGNAAIGTTGSLTVDGAEGYASGDLSLLANGDINITGYYGYVQAGGNLLLNAGGNLNIGGAGGYYNYAYGNASTTAVAGGNLNVLSGDLYGTSYSSLGTSSNTIVTTGGNVVVDRSTIYGYPEVNMQVGGTVSINGDTIYSGRIEAGSPSTINIELTKLVSGGYSVNGVDGALYDALTGSGFLVLGNPAVLGETMMVTYTGASITQPSAPTDALNVAMSQAAKPLEGQQSTGATSSEDDKKDSKKKDLPICGKS
jgi:filamentous hemagglutinin family protein